MIQVSKYPDACLNPASCVEIEFTSDNIVESLGELGLFELDYFIHFIFNDGITSIDLIDDGTTISFNGTTFTWLNSVNSPYPGKNEVPIFLVESPQQKLFRLYEVMYNNYEYGLAAKKDFKYAKLDNELKVFNTDKQGHYFNMVIIQILLLYATDKARLIDKEPAIHRYVYHHSTRRSRIRALVTGLTSWIKSGFKKDLDPLIEKLESMEPYSVDLEIIPYPTLVKILAGFQD